MALFQGLAVVLTIRSDNESLPLLTN